MLQRLNKALFCQWFLFYVPDGLVMQQAAMETRVLCCVDCVRDPPLCSDLFLWWRHTFPRGFHIQHLPCLPPPKARDLSDWLLSIKAIHTPAERVRGHRPSMASTGYHDLAGLQCASDSHTFMVKRLREGNSPTPSLSTVNQWIYVWREREWPVVLWS